MVTETKISPTIRQAYKVCSRIARQHYENFPVASSLLSAQFQRSVCALYAFARTGDDIADEGPLSQEERLSLMTKFEAQLYDIQYGKPPTEPIFIALKHTIDHYGIPIQLLYDLLTAFRQDILKQSYQTFSEVKDYCRYSANPIGRILLHMAGHASPGNLKYSDCICTGLQLFNFLQDIHSDLADRKRCYLPIVDLQYHNISLQDIANQTETSEYRSLIQKQLQRAATIYQQGLPLGALLPGIFGFEIKLIISSGQRLLKKFLLRKNIYERPTIGKKDAFSIIYQAIFYKKLLTPINLTPFYEKL